MRRRVAAVLVVATLGIVPLTAFTSSPTGLPARSGAERAVIPAVPRLTAVRAAAHPGYDRLVFQFAGALPAVHSVSWVPRVVEDPSGRPLSLGGRAFLRVLFRPATAHTSAGTRTYPGALSTRFDLPVLRSVVQAGDFENVLSFGVGLWQRTSLHVFTLPAPPRLVIDMSVAPGAPQRLSELDNGRLVYLRVGQQTTIALRTCVSCGNSWRVVRSPNATVVRIAASSVVPLPHAPGTVGFPSESRWVLRGSGAGSTSLELDERPPQRGAAPLVRYVLRFRVAP